VALAGAKTVRSHTNRSGAIKTVGTVESDERRLRHVPRLKGRINKLDVYSLPLVEPTAVRRQTAEPVKSSQGSVGERTLGLRCGRQRA
jgi:hypothetical protein